MVGREARSRGLNVMLAGGANLARDPRNGRNFEYLSEDPLLSAVLAGEAIAGIQGEGVISTIKHFSLNCNETNRHWLDALIDPAAHRESDLLAFEIAIERGQPGSVMTGYNKVNGVYAGANRVLIEEVLKGAWGYPGWVMSDWGATPTWDYALAGLDQESGAQIDVLMWDAESFTEPLRAAFAEGELPKERLSEMVRRILRSMYAVGIDQWEAGRTAARTTRRRTAPSRWTPRARASCCSRTTASCRSPPTRARGSRFRRLRPRRRAGGHRLERRHPAGRLRGRGPHRRPGDHGHVPQPVPPAVVADAGARRLMPRPTSSSTRA